MPTEETELRIYEAQLLEKLKFLKQQSASADAFIRTAMKQGCATSAIRMMDMKEELLVMRVPLEIRLRQVRKHLGSKFL
jgi:hypothetical protein